MVRFCQFVRGTGCPASLLNNTPLAIKTVLSKHGPIAGSGVSTPLRSLCCLRLCPQRAGRQQRLAPSEAALPGRVRMRNCAARLAERSAAPGFVVRKLIEAEGLPHRCPGHNAAPGLGVRKFMKAEGLPHRKAFHNLAQGTSQRRPGFRCSQTH